MKKAVGNSKKSSQATLTNFFSRQNSSTSSTLQDKTNCQPRLEIKVHNVENDKKRLRSPSKSPVKTTFKRNSSRKTPSPSKKIEQFFTPDLSKSDKHSKRDDGSDDDVVVVVSAPKPSELRRSPRLNPQTIGQRSPIKPLKRDKVKNALFSPAKKDDVQNDQVNEVSFNLDQAFFEDLEPFEMCSTPPVSENLNLSKLDRYKVENCTRLADGDIRLTVKNMVNATSGSCLVKSPWNTCVVQRGDLVSLKGKLVESEGGCWVVDWSGVLVSNPDHLISGTSVVGSLFCMRKAVLSDVFEEIGEREAKYLVIGNVVHQLLQEV